MLPKQQTPLQQTIQHLQQNRLNTFDFNCTSATASYICKYASMQLCNLVNIILHINSSRIMVICLISCIWLTLSSFQFRSIQFHRISYNVMRSREAEMKKEANCFEVCNEARDCFFPLIFSL